MQRDLHIKYEKISTFIPDDRIVQIKFGQVIYNSKESLTEDDILYLSYTRKIIFHDEFNSSIDEIPENIIDIELGNHFNTKINKISNQLKYIKFPGVLLDKIDILKKSNIKNMIIYSPKIDANVINYELNQLYNIISQNLEILHITGFKTNTSLKCLNFSKSLLDLHLSGNSNKLIIHNYPNKLKKIELNCEYYSNNFNNLNNINNILKINKSEKYIDYLPSSLKILYIRHRLKKIHNFPQLLTDVDLNVSNKLYKLSIHVTKIKFGFNLVDCTKFKFKIENKMNDINISTHSNDASINIKLSNNCATLLNVNTNKINIIHGKYCKPNKKSQVIKNIPIANANNYGVFFRPTIEDEDEDEDEDEE